MPARVGVQVLEVARRDALLRRQEVRVHAPATHDPLVTDALTLAPTVTRTILHWQYFYGSFVRGLTEI